MKMYFQVDVLNGKPEHIFADYLSYIDKDGCEKTEELTGDLDYSLEELKGKTRIIGRFKGAIGNGADEWAFRKEFDNAEKLEFGLFSDGVEWSDFQVDVIIGNACFHAGAANSDDGNYLSIVKGEQL